MGKWNGFPASHSVGKMNVSEDGVITWENSERKPGQFQWLGWQSATFDGEEVLVSFSIKFDGKVPTDTSEGFGVKFCGVMSSNEWVNRCEPNEWCDVVETGSCTSGGDGNHVIIIFDRIANKQRIQMKNIKAEILPKYVKL